MSRSYQKWGEREGWDFSKYKEQDANGQRLEKICSVQGTENALAKSLRQKMRLERKVDSIQVKASLIMKKILDS